MSVTVGVGVVVIAGIVAAAGSTAFTNGPPNAAFVGGTVSQSVAGAQLTGIDYSWTDASRTMIDRVDLTFTDGADGRGVTVAAVGAGTGGFTCGPVSATVDDAAVCTYGPTGTELGFADLTSLTVSVT